MIFSDIHIERNQMQYETHKVAADDPTRCQGIDRTGNQCNNQAIEGVKFCGACGGNKCLEVLNNKNIRIYRLAKYRDRLDEMVTHPNVKSLREEIGILRILLEERMASLQTPLEVMAHSCTISDLIIKIERLVTSCHKLEKNLGEYLDKNTITQIGMEMVQIITKYITDPKVIDNICNDMLAMLKRATNESPEETD
jgi:hypothetical protein